MPDNKTEVFRLQTKEKITGLKGGIKDWGKYTDNIIYDADQINAIASSNENTLNEPTSIPSPFARIALTKTAFDEVVKRGEKALKAYQKIVSDSLDVAEIFFTYDKWREKIDIIKWDRKDDLNKLEARGHKQLYKTLKTFLETDAATFNFDRMKCLYILKYKKTSKMIGATSPCTLFFSSANKFENEEDGKKINLSEEITLSNNHCAFDGIFPLHARSWDFQEYLHTWIAVNNNENRIIDGMAPTSIFHEFADYLKSQKLLIKSAIKINALATIDTLATKTVEDLTIKIQYVRGSGC